MSFAKIFSYGLTFMTLSHSLYAQQNKGYDRNYHFLHGNNVTADKNFYILTVFDKTPEIYNRVSNDETLHSIGDARRQLLIAHVTDTCSWPSSLLESFRFSTDDSAQLDKALASLYDRQTQTFDRMIDHHLRPSGYYQRFIAMTNRDLLLHAWGQYVTGINYIIDQFGLGKKMRYPRIDSASYDVNSRYYRTALKDMFAYLSEKKDSMKTFYAPDLAIAMQLMDINDRDEPARFEPMEKGENSKALARIARTQWKNYHYATILIPGNGPELTTTPISPINKMHCAIAADRYKKGWAPFIIVSGGYCYPFRGPYCEAIEMKKYLVQQFNIPASAILIDPHARHTTTNIRNADRLMIRYGLPLDKPSVFVTTKSQTDYAAAESFDRRNIRELGYLPYRDWQHISLHDIVFYPVLESLHMDPYDPLDP